MTRGFFRPLLAAAFPSRSVNAIEAAFDVTHRQAQRIWQIGNIPACDRSKAFKILDQTIERRISEMVRLREELHAAEDQELAAGLIAWATAADSAASDTCASAYLDAEGLDWAMMVCG